MTVTFTHCEAASSGKSELPESLMRQLFDHVAEISSLPHVAVRICDLVSDPKTRADDLAEVVRCDPSLAMRLMRTVNSAYYGMRQKVSDLKHAVAMVGFEEIRNLALTAYVAPLFQETSGHGPYTRKDLWNHMIAAGLVAQLIAKSCGRVSPHEAYLAGLLHDLGLILIDQRLHERFCQIVDALTDQTPACEVEARILGFDHAALGGYAVSKWNLPECLCAAVRDHHALDKRDGPHQLIVDVVMLADFLCHRKGRSPLGAGKLQPLPADLFDQLGLSREAMETIVGQLDDVLTQADVMAEAQRKHVI
ncbi:MAG: HDOD domain-containing protein [Planctomycetota bacterium]|jgi:HD-like signal output (HDOD) protein